MSERTITKGTDGGNVAIFEGLELIAVTGHRSHQLAHERADRIIAALEQASSNALPDEES